MLAAKKCFSSSREIFPLVEKYCYIPQAESVEEKCISLAEKYVSVSREVWYYCHSAKYFYSSACARGKAIGLYVCPALSLSLARKSPDLEI